MLSKSGNTVELLCKKCNGTMIADKDVGELICPYCGSKELILDSDNVAIEKIRNNTYREMELDKIKHEEEKERRQEEKNQIESFRKGKFSKFLLICIVISAIACCAAFSNGKILAVIVALVQAGLYGAAWLMGMKIIPEKKSYLHILIAVVGLILIIPFGWANNMPGPKEKLEWPECEMTDKLPKPDFKYGDVITCSDTTLYVTVEGVSQTEFDDYAASCKENGFDIEVVKTGSDFEAYNEQGYELNLSYYENGQDMKISLDAPKTMGAYVWPSSDVVACLPVPMSQKGNVETDTSERFVMYVGDTSKDQYEDYVNQCIDAGFVVDYSRKDNIYQAKNEDGIELKLRYEGFNIMYIAAEAPKEKEPESTQVAESAQEPETSAANDNQSNSVNPELKEFLDSYEAFIDEYVEFMKKYSQSNNSVMMLADYADYMSKLADFTQKSEKYNADEMSVADSAYYLEVTARVSKKLLEIAY